MQVTEVRLKKSDSTDSCKAYGSITLDGDFVVCGIRFLERKDDGQLFVGFPSRENQKGEYKDICFPMAQILREDITIQVLSEYEKLHSRWDRPLWAVLFLGGSDGKRNRC